MMLKWVLFGALAAILGLSACSGTTNRNAEPTTDSAPKPSTTATSVGLVLEVTDSKDKTVRVTHAEAYQKSTSYTPTKIVRFSGIEVEQGSGRVVVPWDRIDKVEKVADAKSANSGNLVLHLKDGKEVTAPASNYSGLLYIAGETDLGQYELFFGDLKSLRVVQR